MKALVSGMGCVMLDKVIIGKNIAAYRKRRGISQKELAAMLNITSQSVSKWESGISSPTLDMICELSKVLDVSVDTLLSDVIMENRDICYRDTGLDTKKLYELKEEISRMTTDDPNLLLSSYMAPVIFKMKDDGIKEPIYILETSVPGSKVKLAKERQCDREICMDVVATAINSVLRLGFMPKLLKAHIVCGNVGQDRLRNMAKGFKEASESNGVIFAGMGISAQPVNYGEDEYEISVSLIGMADRDAIVTGENITEGDVAIGIIMDGLEASSYPFVKVMLNKKPEMAYKKLDSGVYFPEEVLKPASACTYAVRDLQKENILKGAFRINSSLFNSGLYVDKIPQGLGLCIDMSTIPGLSLYKYLKSLDMVGNNRFHYRFNLGIGMVLIVPEEDKKRAIEIISRYHRCCIIGDVRADKGHEDERVWCEGELQW